MLGILLVNQLYTPILFDPDTTCSFVNFIFGRKFVSRPGEVHMQLYETSPIGTIYHANLIFKDCTVTVGGKNFPINLVQLEIEGWDVILGTDWLAKHKVTLDCRKELITFSAPEGDVMELKENNLLT